MTHVSLLLWSFLVSSPLFPLLLQFEALVLYFNDTLKMSLEHDGSSNFSISVSSNFGEAINNYESPYFLINQNFPMSTLNLTVFVISNISVIIVNILVLIWLKVWTSPSRAWLRLNAFLVLASLPAFLPARLPSCLPVCLLPCLPAYLLTCLLDLSRTHF